MNYELLLREHALKVTPQRLGILSLMQKTGHISIDTLYLEIKKQFSTISLATLYKNIHAMMEKALIKEVKIPHMKSRYEIAKAEHGHLLCQKCGSFTDIKLDLSKALNHLKNESGYLIEESHLVLSGICPRCQQ